MADVAKAAGVSLGSASRVMHAPDEVRETTRKAVQRAAAELGYVPDGRARALASGRSMMVGIVLPTINNPVYAEFAHALQRRLQQDNYSLVVQAHEYDGAAEIAQVRALAGRGVDGLVLVGTDHDPAMQRLLSVTRLPHVFVWSADESPAVGCIGFSNRAAMRELADHLISLGHRRIGVISGSTAGNERARSRLAGIRDAVEQARLQPPVTVFEPFSIAGGRAGLAALLEQAPDLTAVMCTTDLAALGALAEARARGIDVPRDLSITGFDDIDVAAASAPPLTTVRAPLVEMGEAAGTEIIRQLGKLEAAPSVVIPTELILRGSSAAPLSAREYDAGAKPN